VPEGALTVTCPFCASNKVTLRAAAADHLRPTALVPFKIVAEQLRAHAAEWLGKGWMHPAELKSSVVIEHFTGIYLPYWTFDAQVRAVWDAEVGYERSESYYDPGSKTWKTRIVIDWRSENGETALNIDDFIVRATTRASHRLLEQLQPFDMDQLVAYSPDLLAGWQALAYDLTLPVAWEQGKQSIRDQAKDACYQKIPTMHVRNFRMRADFSDEMWRSILLPVYIAAYRFGDRVFQVMVNGQTGAIAGQKPVDWTKVWLAIAGLLAPGLLCEFIGLPMLLAAGLGVVPMFLGVFLLLIGGIIAFLLYRKALESEAD
jgi:hypothetical protein